MSNLKKKQKKAVLKEREKHHKDVLAQAKLDKKKEKVCPNESFISLTNVNKIYPNHVQAVYDFNLNIKEGEFIVFVGPSGCGKSTTLRMIAGLEDITSGDLFIDGMYANEVEPKNRRVGMVFQSYALYPHMTVYENMAFGLRVNHVPREEIDERIHKAAKMLQIEDYLERKPNALSGGQCQRVALGRTIVTNAKVFLMDEPLSNLDAKLRVAMRSEIVKLTRDLKTTTIYVTHDQTEAMTMASRIVVMSEGYIQQIGTPKEIFHTPANLFVATFVGSPAMNIIKGTLTGDDLDLGLIEINDVKNLAKKAESFYINEIELHNKLIEQWKDTYLNREFESKHFERLFKANTLVKAKFDHYIGAYRDDMSEDKYSKLIASFVEPISKEDFSETIALDLKEILFEHNRKENPEIAKIVEDRDALIKEQSSKKKNILLGIRPEHIDASKQKKDNEICLPVVISELLGSEYYVHLSYQDNDLVSKIPADEDINSGDKVYLKFDKKNIHVFDPITSKRIN